ncbi:hypothetical protein HYU19_01150 [Candidatus Woesearchaeota archaeon]|nr:hypothetical protein [Candidatus Woesearchaeota archaeon]
MTTLGSSAIPNIRDRAFPDQQNYLLAIADLHLYITLFMLVFLVQKVFFSFV